MNNLERIKKKAEIRKNIFDVIQRGLTVNGYIKSGKEPIHDFKELLHDFKAEFYVLNLHLVTLGDTECPLSYKDIYCDMSGPFICTSCLINARRIL